MMNIFMKMACVHMGKLKEFAFSLLLIIALVVIFYPMGLNQAESQKMSWVKDLPAPAKELILESKV